MPRDVVAGRAYIEISAKTKELLKKLKGVEGGFGGISKKLKAISIQSDQLGRKLARVSDKFEKIGKGISKFGLGITGPLVLAGTVGARFGDQMATVKGIIGGLTDQEFESLNNKAKELGSTTSFTASEVGEAMVELARQGRNAGEILSAIRPTLDSARAGAVTLAESAELIGGTSNSFGKRDFTEVADIIAKLSTSSSQGFADIQESLKFVAPAANNLKLSLEQTSVALGFLADRNLKGSIAATSLNEVFRSLVKTQVQAKLASEEFGVTVKDSAGDLRDPIDILRDLGEATKNITSVDRASLFTDLFGARGEKAALIIAGSLPDDIERLRGKIDNAKGSAKSLAQTIEDTLGGSFRAATSALEVAGIAFSEVLEPISRGLLESFAEFSREAGAFAKRNPDLVKAIGILGGTAAITGGAFVGLAGAVGVGSFALKTFSGATGIATLAMKSFLLSSAKFIAIGAVVGVGLALISEAIVYAFTGGNLGVSKFIGEIKIAGVKMKDLGLAINLAFINAFDGIVSRVKYVGSSILTAFKNPLVTLKMVFNNAVSKLASPWLGLTRTIAGAFSLIGGPIGRGADALIAKTDELEEKLDGRAKSASDKFREANRQAENELKKDQRRAKAISEEIGKLLFSEDNEKKNEDTPKPKPSGDSAGEEPPVTTTSPQGSLEGIIKARSSIVGTFSSKTASALGTSVEPIKNELLAIKNVLIEANTIAKRNFGGSLA